MYHPDQHFKYPFNRFRLFPFLRNLEYGRAGMVAVYQPLDYSGVYDKTPSRYQQIWLVAAVNVVYTSVWSVGRDYRARLFQEHCKSKPLRGGSEGVETVSHYDWFPNAPRFYQLQSVGTVVKTARRERHPCEDALRVVGA